MSASCSRFPTTASTSLGQAAHYALNASVCFSETAWEYSQIYARRLGGGRGQRGERGGGRCHQLDGRADARSPLHGASGFSYVNDVVLAILSMLHTHERVMFVSTDAWHPSGVEEAFYTTDRVLCVSLHRYTEGFFPGSGGVDDRGHGAGTNHSINMPVLEGLDDDQIASLFVPVVAAAAERFQPSCVVYCAGAGVLAGDRLGCLNVTLEGYGRCLQAVLDIGRPLLVLGAAASTRSTRRAPGATRRRSSARPRSRSSCRRTTSSSTTCPSRRSRWPPSR